MEKLNLKYDTNILSNGERTIRIQYDEFAESPRDLDEGNLSHIYTCVPRYSYGDNNYSNLKDMIDSFLETLPEETRRFIRLEGRNGADIIDELDKKLGDDHVLVPLTYTDHSLVSLGIGYSHDRWDGGYCGMVHVCKADFDRLGAPYDKENFRESAIKAIDNEIDALNDYIHGDCYVFECYEKDSCVECIGGFYLDEKNGFNKEALFEEAGAGLNENSWLVVDESCREFSDNMTDQFDIQRFLLDNFPDRYKIVEIELERE